MPGSLSLLLLPTIDDIFSALLISSPSSESKILQIEKRILLYESFGQNRSEQNQILMNIKDFLILMMIPGDNNNEVINNNQNKNNNNMELYYLSTQSSRYHEQHDGNDKKLSSRTTSNRMNQQK